MEAHGTTNDGNWYLQIGGNVWQVQLYGSCYIESAMYVYTTGSYIGTQYFNSTYYAALHGTWRISDSLYFGESVNGYATTASVNSVKYPYLSGTWYANTIYCGTSTSGYHLRVDPDQVTWYYGTTQVGELESYSTYVDLQGTFKTNGSNWISSSDQKVKNSIEDYTYGYDVLFDGLHPRRYKFNAGTSGRYHTGFVVQEVLAALETAGLPTNDFAAVCRFAADRDKEEEWGLRYEEIISLNTWQIQKLKKFWMRENRLQSYSIRNLRTLKRCANLRL